MTKLDSSCFKGAYKEFVEVLGHKTTIMIHENFAGQYINLPQRLLSEKYVRSQILEEYNGRNAKDLARKYGYTYSWIKKLIKQLKEENKEGN